MRTIITGGKVITPDQTLSNHSVILEDGKITALAAVPVPPQLDDTVIDANQLWVVPGFIDIHIHGGNGHDTMDATPEAIQGIAQFVAQHGVTSFYPTTMTDSKKATDAAVYNIVDNMTGSGGAAVRGIHLEGPYLNPAYKGAQPDTYLRSPEKDEYGPWFATGQARLMTVAPEVDGVLDMVTDGVKAGIEFSIGHSNADYQCVTAAANRGLRQGTHVFNGMLGLHHREPGTLGSILAEDRIYAQLIADGVHVHPAMVKMLIRAKGVEHTILITDAMRATGLADGEYTLGVQDVIVRNGEARLAGGSLAGSTLTLDQAIRNVVEFAGLTFPEAVKMATAVPAAAMNMTGTIGSLTAGANADVTLLDADLNVVMTIVGGEVVYQREA